MLSAESQENLVMKAIYQIKAGMRNEPQHLIIEAIEHLACRGAEAIISGCTEVPIVIQSRKISLPFIDSLDCLAKKVIHYATADVE